MSAHFDLSLLKTLEERFQSLNDSIEKLDTSIVQQEDELKELDEQTKVLESQKLTIQLQLGTMKEERLQLKSLCDTAENAYEKVKESAQTLLNMFD